MLTITYTTRFKRDYKLILKQKKNISKIDDILYLLEPVLNLFALVFEEILSDFCENFWGIRSYSLKNLNKKEPKFTKKWGKKPELILNGVDSGQVLSPSNFFGSKISWSQII